MNADAVKEQLDEAWVIYQKAVKQWNDATEKNRFEGFNIYDYECDCALLEMAKKNVDYLLKRMEYYKLRGYYENC